MKRLRLLLFIFVGAGLVSTAAIFAGRPRGTTVIRVVDPSGAPYAGAVVLVNPGWEPDSIALVTGRDGTVALPRLDCKVCVVTAMDPRRMYFDKTTEFEGGTPSVRLILRPRGTDAKMFDFWAIKADVQVKAPDGKVIADRSVVVRKKVGTMEDNTFSVVRTNRQGRISLKLRPGEYILASFINGRFLEAQLNLAPAAQRRCSEAESDCYLANVVRSPLPAHATVKLAPPGNSR